MSGRFCCVDVKLGDNFKSDEGQIDSSESLVLAEDAKDISWIERKSNDEVLKKQAYSVH